MAEITYLMDSDPGATGYFHEASGYFSARSGNTVVAAPAGQARTLEEVFTDLRTRASGGQVYAVINLVSHATGFSSLQFPISAAHRDDEGGLITSDTLKRALTKAGTDGYPAVLGAPAVTKDTKVVLHGCDVGRDGTFLTMLGQLFGPELTIYAPLRVAVFRHTGATFDYRLARTWSTTYTKDVHTVTDWAPVRTELANKLVAKFKDHGDPAVEATIRSAAQNATDTTPGSFFFSESMETVDDPATHVITGQSSTLPTGTVDDTTIPLQVTSADFKPSGSPGVWVVWIAVLGQVLEDAVSIDNGAQFRKTVISLQKAASVSPLVPEHEPAPPHDPANPDPLEDPMAGFYGKYRATVVSNTDPMLNGRLQVDVPAASVNSAWAEASLPPVAASLISLPETGSTIWVEFEGGDVAFPIWTGVTWGSQVQVPLEITLRATALTLQADAKLTLIAAEIQAETAFANYSGVLKSETLTTNNVIAASYTPGVGNVM
jgi:Type VI secretion system/phage-baseplate injector OB domain